MNKETFTINHSLLGYLQTAVKLITEEQLTNKDVGPGVESNQDNIVLLCDAIERILNHGILKMKKNGSMISYWNYLECLEQKAPEVVNEIPYDWIRRDISQDKTNKLEGLRSKNDEFGKAWIRCALNKKLLSNCLQILSSDKALTNSFYEKYAILVVPDDRMQFLTLLNSLSVLDFRIPLNITDSDRSAHSQPSQEIQKSPPTTNHNNNYNTNANSNNTYNNNNNNTNNTQTSSSFPAPATGTTVVGEKQKKKKVKRRVGIIEETDIQDSEQN